MDLTLDFVVVGPMKTGTSWIHRYLHWHSGVVVPSDVKETFYFTDNQDKGREWFCSHFEFGNENGRVYGEVGPTYFSHPDSVELLGKFSPDCKIVVVLRDPVDRFISHYLHLVRAGNISTGLSIDQAFLENNQLFEQSLYHKNIARWIDKFGEGNVSILLYEELADEPEKFVKKLCEALDVKDMGLPDKLKQPVGKGRIPINRGLVRVVSRLKKKLREKEFHGVVNLVKRLGLNHLLYSKLSHNNSQKLRGIESAYAMLKEDVDRLEEFSVNRSLWKSSNLD